MPKLLLLSMVIIGCARGDNYDQVQILQGVKSVKGGYGGGQYNPEGNRMRLFGNNYNQTGSNQQWRHNLTGPLNLEEGVCYIEVPTASLVRNSDHVPAGNGSRPELSRIRSCCRGYIRNIHNFRKCDPVCTEECINALCSAPETCTCFPDHVKNLAGVCIPTCPIGCQNGRCDGGECLCKEGFNLDSEGKFCVPHCRGNCGGTGNCTAPNTCECKSGFQSTPDGSCRPKCDRCTNGDCVAPNECRCHQGFAKDAQGICAQHCDFGYQTTPQGCKPVCDRCANGDCIAPNDCRCLQGYGKDYQGQCVAQCTPDCGPNRRCVSPNVCDPPSGAPNQPAQPNYPYPTNQPYQNQPNNQTNISPYQPINQNYPLYPDNQYHPENQNQYQVPSGVPQCSQPCLNGFCVDGNRCSCNPGYELDRNDPTSSRCVPHCPGGCPNGVCSSPNFCICNMGYVKDHSVKGRQSCIRRAKRSIKSASNIVELMTAIPDYY